MQGISSPRGIVCASSRTITLFAMLCSLRTRDGRAAKRDSKNYTFVVTMTGAAQSSIASLSLLRLDLSVRLTSCSSSIAE